MSTTLFVPASRHIAPEARATDIEEARRRYRAGGWGCGEDFRCAFHEALRAYELAPSYKLLYTLGRVAVQLEEHGLAHALLRAYLEQGGEAIPSDRRRETEDEITRIEPHTGWLAIVCEGGVDRLELEEVASRSVAPLPQIVRCPTALRMRLSRRKYVLRAWLPARTTATSKEVSVGDEAVVVRVD